MTGAQRRPPIFGPEPWAAVAGVDWCHFDRWFAIVAVGDFRGDLDALEAELIVAPVDVAIDDPPDGGLR